MSAFFQKIYLFFNIIIFSFQYYDMKFGHLFMNYYTAKDCIGEPNKTVSYSIEDEDVLYLPNFFILLKFIILNKLIVNQ